MADRLAISFDTLSKQPHSGARQLALLREYMAIKDDPDALEEFVVHVEEDVLRAVKPSVAAKSSVSAKPSAPVVQAAPVVPTFPTVPVIPTAAAASPNSVASSVASENSAASPELAAAAAVSPNSAASSIASTASNLNNNAAIASAPEAAAAAAAPTEEPAAGIQPISDPDRLYAQEEPELGEDNLQEVEQRETLTQGDCFFSAIFRAAWEGEFAGTLMDCLGINLENEDLTVLDYEKEFIVGFRMKIADELRAGRIPTAEGQRNAAGNIIDLYTNYAQLFETTAVTDEILEQTDYYQVVINKKPIWMKKHFVDDLLTLKPAIVKDPVTKRSVKGNKIEERKQSTFYSREDFLNILIQNIETPTSYVAEIEWRIARRILRDCGFKLVIYNNVGEDMLPKEGMLDGERVPRINLINLFEGHYEYYSFKVDDENSNFTNLEGGGHYAVKKQQRKRKTRKGNGKKKFGLRQTRKLARLQNTSFLQSLFGISQ